MGSLSRCWLVYSLVALVVIKSGNSWSLISELESLILPESTNVTTTTSTSSSSSDNSTSVSGNSSVPISVSAVSPSSNNGDSTSSSNNNNSTNSNSTNSNTTTSDTESPSAPATGGERQTSCTQSFQEDIVVLASIIMDLINEFKDAYVKDKFFNRDWDFIDNLFSSSGDQESLEVCDVDQVCSQVLPTLPDEPLPTTTYPEKLVVASEYVRQYIIAMEQLFLDQSMAEDSYMEEMNKVYRELVTLSTMMLRGVEECQLVPEVSTLMDLMPKMYIRTKSWYQDNRGFRTLRQVLLGMQHIVDLFLEN